MLSVMSITQRSRFCGCLQQGTDAVLCLLMGSLSARPVAMSVASMVWTVLAIASLAIESDRISLDERSEYQPRKLERKFSSNFLGWLNLGNHPITTKFRSGETRFIPSLP